LNPVPLKKFKKLIKKASRPILEPVSETILKPTSSLTSTSDLISPISSTSKFILPPTNRAQPYNSSKSRLLGTSSSSKSTPGSSSARKSNSNNIASNRSINTTNPGYTHTSGSNVLGTGANALVPDVAVDTGSEAPSSKSSFSSAREHSPRISARVRASRRFPFHYQTRRR